MQSEYEIYGWLIGYQKEDIPRVLAIVECKRFEQQNLISAIPQAKEFQEISSLMPQGIGPIGIYHSHPFSSEIFHSHTDDSTLLSLSNQFSNCISIVTNGEEIIFYRMGRKSKAKEIQAEFINPDIPQFLLISIDEKLHLKINNNIFNNRTDESKLKIMILNTMKDYLEDIWIEFEFSYNNSKISENDSIKPYLVNNLTAESVQLIVPEKFKEGNKIKLIINNIGGSEELNVNQDQTYFSLNMKAKIPIYITDKNKTFQKVNQTIKTELLSNNILPKIYNCVTNYDKKIMITPDDYYLNFFGFLIRVLSFNKKELNKNEFSQKTYEILTKLIALFDNFLTEGLTDKMRNQVIMFFNNTMKLSKKFTWEKKINKQVKNMKKKIN